MAIAGTLAVNILARTDKFNKGIKSARTSLSRFGKSVASIGKGVGGLGASLIGVAGVAGFATFFKSTVDSVDRLSKLSEQIGTTTEDLGLLSFQADLSGVSQDNLAKSMLKFSRTLSDAQNGLTTAIRPLDRLGLSAERLIRLDPGAAFAEVAAAMKTMTNPLQRSATAMELFGRSGAELIPLFNSDLDGAAEAFKKMGGAINQADANKLVAFKDAMTELSAAVGAKGRDFVIGITPIALEAVKGLQVLVEDLRPKTDPFRKAPTRPEKRGTIGRAIRGGQLLGADILRTITTGELLPIAKSNRKRQQLERELAGPRLTPQQFERENRERAEQRREQRRQTTILLESLELQRRAVLDRTATVTLEPATFE